MVEINGSKVRNQAQFLELCEAAAILGTVQASYTNFPYLRPIWKQVTEEEALLGVSITGMSNNIVEKYGVNLTEGASIVNNTNKDIALLLGISESARTTCIKPSGTASLVLGTSYGIHAWHDNYYKRRIEIERLSPIYTYLKMNNPYVVEDSLSDPKMAYFPLMAPEGAVLRSNESPIDFLERIKYIQETWIQGGHLYGNNKHNVSATVTVDDTNDNEWHAVGEWMWNNRYTYHGLSVLPLDGGTYQQTPYETISRKEYLWLLDNIKSLDTSLIKEDEDLTDLVAESGCAGGACEI
jgi:ribonucleoside-triphosphate reductase